MKDLINYEKKTVTYGLKSYYLNDEELEVIDYTADIEKDINKNDRLAILLWLKQYWAGVAMSAEIDRDKRYNIKVTIITSDGGCDINELEIEIYNIVHDMKFKRTDNNIETGSIICTNFGDFKIIDK